MSTLTREALEQIKQKPSFFAETVLHFKPFDYQQKLLSDTNKRVIACMGRQTGKTTTIATKAIHYAFTHPKTTTLIISPSLRQSMIMFDKILTFTHSNPLLRKSITRKTRTIVQLTNASTIIALPCSEHLLRGYTANLAICDEASFIPESIITEILFPMLSTTNGTAIFLSTPWDKNHFFYKTFLNPNYSTHKIPSTENPLIPQAFLAEMEQNMTTEAYKREYLAEFTEAAASYFPQELIRQCIEHAQRLSLEPYATLEQQIPKGEYYAGIDLGKLQDHSALAVVQREDETLKLVYTHEFPLETSYTQVIATAARANTRFKLQKLARQNRKAVIAATTHTDLAADLAPNVHIHKSYGKTVTVQYHPNANAKECTLTRQTRITEGTLQDYKQLSQFHYRTASSPAPRKIFTLKRKNETIGAIIYSYPPHICFGRAKAWKGTIHQLQREVSAISRVVLHPKYRSIGLGSKLVRETLAQAGTPHVETVAVMARYNPFFEKAGMQRIAESKPNSHVTEALQQLRKLGFDPALMANAQYLEQKIQQTSESAVRNVLTQLSKRDAAVRRRLATLTNIYPKHHEFTQKINQLDATGLAKTLKRLSFTAQTKTYLFWSNPRE